MELKVAVRLLLRAAAVGAGAAWGWLCWRAFAGPESAAAEQWRTAAFVIAFAAASFGWQPKPPKPGSRYKERL